MSIDDCFKCTIIDRLEIHDHIHHVVLNTIMGVEYLVSLLPCKIKQTRKRANAAIILQRACDLLLATGRQHKLGMTEIGTK